MYTKDEVLKKIGLYAIGMTLSGLALSYLIESQHQSYPKGSNLPEKIEISQNRRNLSGGSSLGSNSIIYTMFGLLLGAFIREIKKKTNIPYTPMILAIGFAIGYFHTEIPVFDETVKQVNMIDPHDLLMIFIPGLIFESAYNTEGYTLYRTKWQILLLAGPGVIATTVILSYGLLYLFGYKDDISFEEALVIGSIIATTDPVAVVALLKELGTSVKFNTLLEGESLLNDGTAYVFFLICLEVVRTGQFDLEASVIKFLRLSFGGPALGIVVGYFCSKWLEVIFTDTKLLVMISVFGSYAIFFFSETYLQVSGILGLVAFGVYLGAIGRSYLTHENDHSVHTIWGFLAFVLETLIFLITGTYAGEHFTEIKLGSQDLIKGIIFYFFVMGVRYGMNLISYPLMQRMGYGTDCTSTLILSYGGLRGAIALSLGMLIALDHSLKPKFKDICLYFVVCVILMTILINGLTIKFLMKVTGFLKQDEIKLKMKHNLLKGFILSTVRKQKELQQDEKLGGVNWGEVEKLVHLSNYKRLERLHKKRLKLQKIKRRFKRSKSIINLAPKTENVANREPLFNQGYSPIRSRVLENDNISPNKSAPGEEKSPQKDKSSNEFNLNHLNHMKAPDSSQVPDDELNNQGLNSENRVEIANVAGAARSEINLNFDGGADIESSIYKSTQKMNDGNMELDGDRQSEDLLAALNESGFANIDKESIKKELRYRVYKLLKHKVNEKYDNNECSASVVWSVKLLCSICIDKVDEDVRIFENSKTFIASHGYLEFLIKMSSLPLLGGYCLRSASQKIFFEFQFLDTLLTCTKSILKEMKKSAELTIEYKEEIKQIREEIILDIDNLVMLKDSLITQFSSFIGFIRTKMAAYSLVEYQKSLVTDFEHMGLLDGSEKVKWVCDLNSRVVGINRYKGKDNELDLMDFKSVALDFPVFGCLSQKEMEMLMETKNLNKFKESAQVFDEHDECDYLYLVSTGVVVEAINKGKKFKLGKGNIVGGSGVCNIHGTYMTSLTTVTDCSLYKINKLIILDLFKRNKEFENNFYQQNFPLFLRYLEARDPRLQEILNDIETSKLHHLGRYTIIHKLQKRDKIQLPLGGMMLNGRLYIQEENLKLLRKKSSNNNNRSPSNRLQKYEGIRLIGPSNDTLTAATDSYIYEFKIKIFQGQTKRRQNFEVNFDELNSSVEISQRSIYRRRKKKKTSFMESFKVEAENNQVFGNNLINNPELSASFTGRHKKGFLSVNPSRDISRLIMESDNKLKFRELDRSVSFIKKPIDLSGINHHMDEDSYFSQDEEISRIAKDKKHGEDEDQSEDGKQQIQFLLRESDGSPKNQRGKFETNQPTVHDMESDIDIPSEQMGTLTERRREITPLFQIDAQKLKNISKSDDPKNSQEEVEKLV